MNSDLVISFFDCCKNEGMVFSCKGEAIRSGAVFRSVSTCSSGEYFSFAVSAFESAWRLAERSWQEISSVCLMVAAAGGKIKRHAVRVLPLPMKRFSFTGRRFLAQAGILRI